MHVEHKDGLFTDCTAFTWSYQLQGAADKMNIPALQNFVIPTAIRTLSLVLSVTLMKSYYESGTCLHTLETLRRYCQEGYISDTPTTGGLGVGVGGENPQYWQRLPVKCWHTPTQVETLYMTLTHRHSLYSFHLHRRARAHLHTGTQTHTLRIKYMTYHYGWHYNTDTRRSDNVRHRCATPWITAALHCIKGAMALSRSAF